MINNNLITNSEEKLSKHIKKAIRKSNNIMILASFIMESGVRLILEDLRNAHYRKAKIRILTGYYLGITEPSALYLLKLNFGNDIDIRVFKHNDVSFHPKTYIFEDNNENEIYIGSSNLSVSALETGVEWNYKISGKDNVEVASQFIKQFDDLFYNHSYELTEELLKTYSISWKKNKISRQASKFLKDLNTESENDKSYRYSDKIAEEVTTYGSQFSIKPYGAQIEALYYLEKSRIEVSKGLVVMATGVGKTFLAAFDSRKFNKILFIAHREEILNQALESFSRVMPEKRMGMFKAGINEKDSDVLFASVQTLGKEKYLTGDWFNPNHFDYIIVDEFHHVAAQSYKSILDYFKPKFLLGLTATPFRMDNQDIFSFCDDNLIYEINLKEAIERDYLVPFNYYGIYDETDYGKINYINGKYDEQQLDKALTTQKRAELVLKYYKIYGKNRSIAFCSSINHANKMAEEFCKAGIPSVAVHTGIGEYTETRKEAIEKLKAGKLKVLFAVDIFNEGVDIPEIDTVLFLRPTESYTVFIQQLGRGLRKCENKARVNVLDFIGNYKLAPILPVLLSGKNPMIKENRSTYEVEYPDECNVQFDMKLIDLFEELKKNDKIKVRLENEYFRLKAQLGKRPTRMDLYEGSDLPTKEFLKKGYLDFLEKFNELTDEEKSWMNSDAEKFLLELEKMSLQKLYKIPTILAFIEDDRLEKSVSAETVGKSMMEFYKNPQYAVDMQDESSKGFMDWDAKKFTNLAIKMPINFINKSSKFFNYDEINRRLILEDSIHDVASPGLVDHISDIIRYRLHDKCAKLYKSKPTD